MTRGTNRNEHPAAPNRRLPRHYVPESEVIGAVVVSVEIWGPITVEKDGRRYEIRQVEGYSGTENTIDEVKL